jgi:hypothetical protein
MRCGSGSRRREARGKRREVEPAFLPASASGLAARVAWISSTSSFHSTSYGIQIGACSGGRSSGQFGDLEGPAHRILQDDDETSAAGALIQRISRFLVWPVYAFVALPKEV